MEAAFAWIGQLIGWFGQWIPRWEIVPTTHGWVKWVKGSKVTSGGAGVVWYWPATTKFEMYPTARQTINLPTQTLTTVDLKTFIVGGMLTYEIKDVETILANTWDPENTVQDIAMGAVIDACTGLTWEELTNELNSGKLYVAIRREMAKELNNVGVKVVKARLTDFAPCRTYRLVQAQ